MYITGFYLLLSDLLIQFTSLHCPYVFALMPQLKPNELYFCMSLTLRPCFLQLLESIIIVLTIWFYTLASWVVCQFKLGLLDLCFEIKNMLGCCCFFNNNWFSHRQQLSAISGDSKYCICKCSVRVTQKDWQPVLWALMRSLCFTCCTTDVLQEVVLLIFVT